MEELVRPAQLASSVETTDSCSNTALVQAVDLIQAKHPRLVSFVKQHPVTRLIAGPASDIGLSPDVGGMFVRHKLSNDTRILINTDMRNKIIYMNGLAWKPFGSKLHTVAHRSHPDEFNGFLLIHEFGHHVCYQATKNREFDYYAAEGYNSANDAGRFVSEYATINPDEWFAESFSAYVTAPDELKEFDRHSYEVMKATGL